MFLGIQMANFCQQILKQLGSYMRVFSSVWWGFTAKGNQALLVRYNKTHDNGIVIKRIA